MKLRDVAILTEAVLLLGLAAFCLAFVPFRYVAKHGVRTGGRPARTRDEVMPVRRAVRRAARNVRWRAMCFEQGLAAHAMLRRRGLSSVLHYGVAREEADRQRGLKAHVWVTSGDQMVVGGEVAGQFTELATFPGQRKQDVSGGRVGGG